MKPTYSVPLFKSHAGCNSHILISCTVADFPGNAVQHRQDSYASVFFELDIHKNEAMHSVLYLIRATGVGRVYAELVWPCAMRGSLRNLVILKAPNY